MKNTYLSIIALAAICVGSQIQAMPHEQKTYYQEQANKLQSAASHNHNKELQAARSEYDQRARVQATNNANRRHADVQRAINAFRDAIKSDNLDEIVNAENRAIEMYNAIYGY